MHAAQAIGQGFRRTRLRGDRLAGDHHAQFDQQRLPVAEPGDTQLAQVRPATTRSRAGP